MKRNSLFIALGAVAATACSAPAENGLADQWQTSLNAIVDTELAFARLAADSTVQHAFLTYVDPDGILFRPGPVAAHSWLRQSPMPDDVRLEWQPAWADVSIDGSLGYTTGPWHYGLRSQPDQIAAAGQYLTLWKKSGTTYVAVLDFGTGNPVSAVQPQLALAGAPVVPEPVMDAVAARQSVQIADEDLDATLSSDGSTTWAHYAHATVRWLRDGQEPVTGPSAVPQDAYGKLFSSLGSGAADSGDLAYTWGEWRFDTEPDGDAAGQYVRIWRRDPDGQWKVTVDAVTGSG